MNEVEFISKLARSDGDGPVLTGDVTDRVIATLRNTDPPQDTPMWRTFAAVGCVAAVIAVAGAVKSWSSLSNPLWDLNDTPTAVVMR